MTSAQDVLSIDAGVARGDITPEPGIRLTGYAVRIGESQSVDEPLRISALALGDGGSVVLIVALDLCLVDVAHATQLRQACAEAAGTSLDHVLVNFNHTHSAPSMGIYNSCFPAAQREMHDAYWADVMKTARRTCAEARSSMVSSRFSSGIGECDGNINRRQLSPDGGVVLGENPDGPCDSSVRVLRFDREDGQPLAVLFRYSCHPVTLGPKTNRISPDFPGPARRLVEQAMGCPAIFLQGCGGNMNPASGIGQDAEASPLVGDDMTRLGHRLGSAVLSVVQKLDTHRRRKEPVFVESVGRYWLYETEAIPTPPRARIAVRATDLELPLVPFPDAAEIQREVDDWDGKLAGAAAAAEATEWALGPLLRFRHWVGLRQHAAATGSNPVHLKFPLQEIRLGHVRLCAIPFETMAETGFALTDALGPETIALGFSNGLVSYLPTPAVSLEGGMESKLGYKAYLIPAEIPGNWEPLIRDWFTNSEDQ